MLYTQTTNTDTQESRHSRKVRVLYTQTHIQYMLQDIDGIIHTHVYYTHSTYTIQTTGHRGIYNRRSTIHTDTHVHSRVRN